MRILKPGESLLITRVATAIGREQGGDALLEYHLLKPGDIVRYITPSWVEVQLADGSVAEVHITALEIIPLTKGDGDAA